jgi:hypothetical protein
VFGDGAKALQLIKPAAANDADGWNLHGGREPKRSGAWQQGIAWTLILIVFLGLPGR